MSNTCSPIYSCGTENPIWTDEEAPEDVVSLAAINVYASAYQSSDPLSNCKQWTFQVQAMRCSLDTGHNLIYRYIGVYRDNCSGVFCGSSYVSHIFFYFNTNHVLSAS